MRVKKTVTVYVSVVESCTTFFTGSRVISNFQDIWLFQTEIWLNSHECKQNPCNCSNHFPTQLLHNINKRRGMRYNICFELLKCGRCMQWKDTIQETTSVLPNPKITIPISSLPCYLSLYADRILNTWSKLYLSKQIHTHHKFIM
jgi:hypothetical protein